MSSRLLTILEAEDEATRDRALEEVCATLDGEALVAECAALERYRRNEPNLYRRVRALFFLHALHRFHLPRHLPADRPQHIPYDGVLLAMDRRFAEAIDRFLAVHEREGPGDAISSALASAYHQLAFQTLADQVRKSVRSVRGNQWMFRIGHPSDHPLRVHPTLHERDADGRLPRLEESTPVRMDLSHSGWSDIFFLGMDHPGGARVLNISIDLAVRGRHTSPEPPVRASLRVLDRPVLRLVSTDLEASAEIDELAEVFDFGRDHLGLLKAGLIAAGIVPPAMEGSGARASTLLTSLVGPGKGLELVTSVRDIPKGSRLAVSTTLLAAIIAVAMRATSQVGSLEGTLTEPERRLVAARAILGEWLGGSGGGWQDSGGVWPAFKLIEGVAAAEGDPEFGSSRGRLLPKHRLLDDTAVPSLTRRALEASLVLVHGGMAQNVGPILEMVTEKYLLRSPAEWRARADAAKLLDEMLVALRKADLRRLGELTTQNFFGPIRTIVPWASNHFTETVVDRVRERFADRFWGFWMLGGMAGGGMGFLFAPEVRAEAGGALAEILAETKRELESALPFAMDPVVYSFAVNEHGTRAQLRSGDAALHAPAYYRLLAPDWLLRERSRRTADEDRELGELARAVRERPEWQGESAALFERLFPQTPQSERGESDLRRMLEELGFDPVQHESIRADLRAGRVGLAQNRLPVSTRIRDVSDDDVLDLREPGTEGQEASGRAAIHQGRAAVVTLAAGAASRWTQGAGVVKALHPFHRFGGRYRSFFEVHRAKSRRRALENDAVIDHVFTTSHFTHAALMGATEGSAPDSRVRVRLSPGRSVGLRLVPTERDLRFLFEETRQQVLDERAERVRRSVEAAWIGWAMESGEARDYTDNEPLQCLHPVGHWYEIPNLLLGGVLAEMLEKEPRLEVLLVHNIDTLGADLDPAILGNFLDSDAALAFEVVPRRIEDRGGGLARVDGRPRLVESLALPREEDEFALRYYNSLTTWVRIDGLLDWLELDRARLRDRTAVTAAVRRASERLPTYVTIKEVKKRWGHGQEDVFPVAQFEKLWGDMSSLSDVTCDFYVVDRRRGQQLKDPAQLDGWLRDGSASYVEALCEFADRAGD